MSNIKPLFILQRRAVRIIHKVDFREHTKRLFIKSGLLKPKYLVELLQTLLIMYRAKSRVNISKVFSSGDGDHRRKFHQYPPGE